MLAIHAMTRAAQAVADSGSADVVVAAVAVVVILALVFTLISIGRVFARAGEPAWAVIVPVYSLIVLLRVARMSPWWLVLLIIPYVNALALIPVCIGVAKRFGRGAGFGLGLWALPFVFYPLLAASEAAPGAHRFA